MTRSLTFAMAVGALAGALGFTAPGAHAQAADIAWNTSGQASREFPVAPAKFVEWCGRLHAGDKISWQFESSAPVDFNIHYHQGKDVVFPEKKSAATNASGAMTVAVEQDYCWMWTNKSANPATVKATIGKAS